MERSVTFIIYTVYDYGIEGPPGLCNMYLNVGLIFDGKIDISKYGMLDKIKMAIVYTAQSF